MSRLRAEEERVAARGAEVEALNARLAAAEREREAMRTSVASIGKEVSQQVQAVKLDLTAPLSFFRQSEGEVEAEMRALAEARDRLQAELTRVRGELADGKKAWEASRAKAGASGAALSGMAVGLGTVVGEVRAAEEDSQRLAKALKMMMAEVQEGKERLRRAEEGQLGATEELGRLEAELGRMKRRAEEAEGAAERYKEELVEALGALEGEAEAARGAGEESEQAMHTIQLVREELVAAVKDRDRFKEAARVAREEAEQIAAKAEENIQGLRAQLRENVHQMSTRMAALQSENDDAFSAMRMLHDQVTELHKELRKRSGDWQAKIEALEAQCAGVGVAVTGQESELLAQQCELDRACDALEKTLARLRLEQQAVKMGFRASMQLKVWRVCLAA